jgi:hypothetical protein
MRVQSIRAPVQVRHIAGNRFFGLAVKMTLRKMHAIAERHYLPKEIRAMTKALQYARHLLPARMRAPFVIDFGEFAGGVCIFNKVDLVLHFLFHHGRVSFVVFLCSYSKRTQWSASCVSGQRKTIRVDHADHGDLLPSSVFLRVLCS